MIAIASLSFFFETARPASRFSLAINAQHFGHLLSKVRIALFQVYRTVQITSKTIRRLTTLHGAISFFFNATVLALAVNIVSSLMRPDQG